MRRSALLLLPLALVLSGCGGESSDQSASGDPASTESANAGSDELDPSMCQDPGFLEDNAEFCYGGGYVGAPANDGLEPVELGTPYELADFEDPDSRETMTVKSVECGLAELPGALSNMEWDGSDDSPRTLPAEADPGMTFCRVTATWQNTGKKPTVGWTDFENLVAADGTEYAEDEKAAEATQQLNECSPYLCSTINPNTPALDVVKIYQVPEGTQTASIRWPRATISSGPVVEFLLE